jgi:hypothetical protein
LGKEKIMPIGNGAPLLTIPITIIAGVAGMVAKIVGAPDWGAWTITIVVGIGLLVGLYLLLKPDEG